MFQLFVFPEAEMKEVEQYNRMQHSFSNVQLSIVREEWRIFRLLILLLLGSHHFLVKEELFLLMQMLRHSLKYEIHSFYSALQMEAVVEHVLLILISTLIHLVMNNWTYSSLKHNSSIVAVQEHHYLLQEEVLLLFHHHHHLIIFNNKMLVELHCLF